MFVIHRRTVREDRSATASRPDGLPNTYREAPSAMWFVQDGKIYPTPTLYGVVAARLVRVPFTVGASKRVPVIDPAEERLSSDCIHLFNIVHRSTSVEPKGESRLASGRKGCWPFGVLAIGRRGSDGRGRRRGHGARRDDQC